MMKVELSNRIDLYKKSCLRVRTLAFMMLSFSNQLPNPPNVGPIDDVARLKVILSRSINRMLYFAEQYVKCLENEIRVTIDIVEKNNTQQFARVINDSLFFYFDAFVFSSKVITEKKLLDIGKAHFHTSIRNTYSNYLNGILNGSNIRLRKIRNEISHLNYYGTSVGSMLQFDNGNFVICSEHKNANELLTLFNELFMNSIEFIEEMARFIFQNDCAKYGNPKRDIVWNDVVKNSEFVTIDT